jgi:hypothetical protein
LTRQSSGVTFQDLPCFSLPRCFFSSTRFCLAASGILVGLRWGSCLRACCSNSMKRSRATSLFAAWLRVFWEMTRRIPFLLIRVANPSRTSCLCSEVRLKELITSKPSVTRVLALLTCCPPGPLLREAVNFSSSLGIESSSVIRIMKTI